MKRNEPDVEAHLLIGGEIEQKIGNEEGFGGVVVKRDVLVTKTGEVTDRRGFGVKYQPERGILRAMV